MLRLSSVLPLCLVALALMVPVRGNGCLVLREDAPHLVLSWSSTDDDAVRFRLEVSGDPQGEVSTVVVAVSPGTSIFGASRSDVFLATRDGLVLDAHMKGMKLSTDDTPDIKVVSFEPSSTGFSTEFVRPLKGDGEQDVDLSIAGSKHSVYWAYWDSPNYHRRPTSMGGAEAPLDLSSKGCSADAKEERDVRAESSNGVCGWGRWSNDQFELQWAVTPDRKSMDFTMTARTTGWLSFGINWRYKMDGSDYYTGWVKNGVAVVYDTYCTGREIPYLDTEAGGSDDVTNVSGEENSTHTVLRFSRLLHTGDKRDYAITDRKYWVMWAIANQDGSSGTDYEEHDSFGGVKLNFFDCSGTVETSSDLYLNSGHVLVITCVVGFLGFSILFFAQKRSQKTSKTVSPKENSLEVAGVKRTGVFSRLSNHLQRRAFELNPVWTVWLAGLYVVFNIIWALVWIFAWPGKLMTSGSERVARVLGQISAANMLITTIPVTRNTFLWYFCGAPFERTLPFHRWVGRWTICVIIAHTIAFFVQRGADVVKIGKFVQTPQVVALVALGFGLLIAVTSFGWVRRKHFDLFHVVHFGFLPFMVLAVIHNLDVIVFVAIALVLWAIDRVIRFFIARPRKILEVTTLPDSVIRLRWKKNKKLSFEPAQYVFVCFPSASKLSFLHWHPFTLTSAAQSPECEVNIRALGDYTSVLAKVLQSKTGHTVMAEGPYGSIPFNVRSYRSIVIVCNGIGVTPMISVLRSLYCVDDADTKFEFTNPGNIRSVAVHWGLRKREQYSWFSQVLDSCQAVSDSNREAPRLHLNIHCSTGENFEPPFSKGRIEARSVISSAVESEPGPIAVLGCGPPALLQELWDLCAAQRSAGNDVSFHYESFNF